MVPEHRRVLPHVNRSLLQVEHALVSVFDALVNGRASWPLFLHGKPGRGKTLACLALCDIVETARFDSTESLASLVMKLDVQGADAEFEHIGGKSLAVLDELGAREKIGDLGYGIVKRFCDAREQQAGRASIFTSNLPPHAIAGLYDDRIASRVLCGTIFELKGKDRRKTDD